MIQDLREGFSDLPGCTLVEYFGRAWWAGLVIPGGHDFVDSLSLPIPEPVDCPGIHCINTTFPAPTILYDAIIHGPWRFYSRKRHIGGGHSVAAFRNAVNDPADQEDMARVVGEPATWTGCGFHFAMVCCTHCCRLVAFEALGLMDTSTNRWWAQLRASSLKGLMYRISSPS